MHSGTFQNMADGERQEKSSAYTMLKKSRDSIGVSSIWVMFFLPFSALVGVLGPLSMVMPSLLPPFLGPPPLGNAREVLLSPLSDMVKTEEGSDVQES